MTGKIYSELHLLSTWTIAKCMKVFHCVVLFPNGEHDPPETSSHSQLKLFRVSIHETTVVMQCFILYLISFQKSKYLLCLLIKDTHALDRVKCLCLNVLKRRFIFRSPKLTYRLKPDHLIHWGLIFFLSRVGRIILDIKMLWIILYKIRYNLDITVDTGSNFLGTWKTALPNVKSRNFKASLSSHTCFICGGMCSHAPCAGPSVFCYHDRELIHCVWFEACCCVTQRCCVFWLNKWEIRKEKKKWTLSTW